MDVRDAVAREIAQAQQAPTTAQIVEALNGSYSEGDVLQALEYLHREIDAEEGVDGRWTWLGAPVSDD